MDFTGNKAIYLQIVDYICDRILLDDFKEDERIPSVREIASQMEVNSNTVVKAYDWLQNHEIIFTKRGLGFFVNNGAKQAILKVRRKAFIEEQVPELSRTMQTLGISMEELAEYLHTINN